jgi:hypothetical protein
MKKLIIFAILAFSATSIFAQREQTVIGDSGLGFSGAWGGWSYNYGKFNKDQSGSYNGGMWALEFGKKLYIGGLHYNITNQRLNNSDVFNLRSNNLLLGYTPLSYKAIHPVISVAVGAGKIKTSGEAAEDHVFVVHPAAGFELNVARWCHIDAQVGYRVVNDANFIKYKNADFSGLYGQVNLKFGFSWGRYKHKDVD